MIVPKISKLIYGGDYNPEQWDPAVWREDVKLMKEAGVNMVSLAIFSWALLEPREGEFDFGWLDEVMDLLAENGIAVDLATATAAQPAWMSLKYPDVLAVTEEGTTLSYGSRQVYCPNSPSYRRGAARLTEAMARRYKDHLALVMWHINNEYACHIKACYCDTCAAAFRVWLKERYENLEGLNRAWGTRFWSQVYHEWEEILPPRKTSTIKNPGQVLDYARFMSRSLQDCCTMERDILKKITPQLEVTTNFMLQFKEIDYFKWAPDLDIISWDSYPNPAPGNDPADPALDHDLMRSLGKGKPFLLMEQSPGAVNWREVNVPKPPGKLELDSLQAVARGADGVLYFQWRQSRRGAEKYHAGCVPHQGRESRIFREVTRLGRRLEALSGLRDSRIEARTGLVVDYESWWALEGQAVPSQRLRYRDQLLRHYRGLYRRNLAVDILPQTGPFEGYSLLVVPCLYLLEPDTAAALTGFVEAGGTLVVTFFSGIADKEESIYLEGYGGPLRPLLGLTVEEFCPLEPHMTQKVEVAENPWLTAGTYPVNIWSEVIRPEGAEVIGRFTEDYPAGTPAVTVNRVGKGKAVYLGADLPQNALDELLGNLAKEAGAVPAAESDPGVEVSLRRSETAEHLFALNFNARAAAFTLPGGGWFNAETGEALSGRIELAPRQCLAARRER